MELVHYRGIMIIGFLFWLIIAPRASMPNYGDKFLAYMVALLVCLVGTSEIMMTKPTAFFFTVGGALAFVYILARLSVRVKFEHKG